MICPYCKLNIEGNLYFCDQCGQEILVCPTCNQLGKGKRCVHDGSPLVTARSKSESSGVPPAKKESADRPHAGVAEAEAVSGCGSELRLINRTLGLDLKITGDETIGRQHGGFAEIFRGHEEVSGRHCQIKFDHARAWTVTDLGSTNGTKLDNLPLQPGQARPLTDRCRLLIANLEFYTEIRSTNAKGGTKRL